MWTRCLISPLFALFVSFHTVLLFLEAYQLLFAWTNTHSHTNTDTPVYHFTQLLYHLPLLFSSPLLFSIIPGPWAHKMNILNHRHWWIILIKQVCLNKNTLAAHILGYIDSGIRQSWIGFICVRESKIKQTARRLVCFKGNHTMMVVYLQQRHFFLYLQTIDRCDKLCMLL